jgi:hypothetical protein
MRRGGFVETPHAVVVGMLRGRRDGLGAGNTVASAAQGSDCHMRAPPIGTPFDTSAPAMPTPRRHAIPSKGNQAQPPKRFRAPESKKIRAR